MYDNKIVILYCKCLYRNINFYKKRLEILKNTRKISNEYYRLLISIETNSSVFSMKITALILIEQYMHGKFNEKYYFIDISKNGKVILKNTKFFISISHTNGIVVVSFFDVSDVGIDIEKTRKLLPMTFQKLDWLSKIYINQSKKEQDFHFTKIWTIKESYLKYLGVGLSKKIDSFLVYPFSDWNYIFDTHMRLLNVFSKTLYINDYIISVTSDVPFSIIVNIK